MDKDKKEDDTIDPVVMQAIAAVVGVQKLEMIKDAYKELIEFQKETRKKLFNLTK